MTKAFLFVSFVLCTAPVRAQTLERIDLAPGPKSSTPSGFVPFSDRVAFFAADTAGRPFLWNTDGTAVGTTPLVGLPDGTVVRSGPVSTGSRLYFTASSLGFGGERLWTSDGTLAGTVALTPLGVATGMSLGLVGSRLFFSAQTSAEGSELWTSDGTPEGTRLVRDINPRQFSSLPSSLRAVHGRLYFVADDGAHGREIWRSDGTAEGTEMLANLTADNVFGPAGGSSVLGVLGQTLLLSGRTLDTGRELWASDGTAQSTRLLRDLAPGSASSSPAYLTLLGSHAYFIASVTDDATSTTTHALWRTDGTADGTTLVREIATTSQTVGYMTATDQRLFFLVNAGSSNAELWTSDGTPGGTQRLRALEVVIFGSTGFGFAPLGDRVYFSASSPSGSDLWQSDGTLEGTRPVGTQPLRISPFVYARLDTRLVFRGKDFETGEELWTLHPAAPTPAEPRTFRAGKSLTVVGTSVVATGLEGDVTLDAVDVLGRRVAMLAQGPLETGAALRLPAALAPGLYFARAIERQGVVAVAPFVVRR